VLLIALPRLTRRIPAPLVALPVAAVLGWFAARRRLEGRAFLGFAGFLVAGAATIFVAAYPAVLPSTIDPAFDLTVANASSSDYTLGVMTIVAGVGLPVVLAYQAWSYWVFRKRLRVEHLPVVQVVVPAVRS